MKKAIFALALFGAMLFVACKKHNDDKNNNTPNSNIQGTWNVVGQSSAALYDDNNNMIGTKATSYDIETWIGFSSTKMYAYDQSGSTTPYPREDSSTYTLNASVNPMALNADLLDGQMNPGSAISILSLTNSQMIWQIKEKGTEYFDTVTGQTKIANYGLFTDTLIKISPTVY